MRKLFVIFLILQTSFAWSCLNPTGDELSHFFEGSSLWTEVTNENSHTSAENRPVFLNISFTNSEKTQIQWGTNVIKGADISLCWRTRNRKKLQIRRRFFTTTLIKIKPGLMKSWIPFDGDLYYRKDAEVKRPSQDRQLAEEV